MAYRVIYGAQQIIEGMRSSPDPSVLPIGVPTQLTNFRIEGGVLMSRYGIDRVGSSPTQVPQAAGTTYARGNKALRFTTGLKLIEFWSNSGGAGNQLFLRNTSNGQPTELTSTSGKYGSTVFSNGPNEGYSVAIVRDPINGKEYAVIVTRSSSDYPRVYDPTQASNALAIHEPVTPPQQKQDFAITPTFPKYFTVNDESTTTLSTGTASRFVAADQGTSPENYVRFTRDTTASTDPTRVMQFSAAVDLSDCPQLVILHDTVVPFWWEICKLEISEDGVTYSTVWDPENPTGKISVPHDPRTTRAATAFPLDHIASASRNSVAYFRLTYLASAPTSSQTFDVYGIFGSGKAPGQRFHAFAYLNSGSRARSRAMVCDVVLPKPCKELGTANLTEARIPWDEAILYNYTIPFLNTSDAERNKGVDTLLIFANDPGDPDGFYPYVTSVTLAEYSAGAWNISSGSAYSQRTTTDSTPTTSRNLEVLAPDDQMLPIPTGDCLVNIGNRLVVGRYESGSGTISSPNYAEVWISSDYDPFMFRKRQKDESSGTRFTLTGEVPMALAKGPTSIAGVESAFLITNQNTYIFGGVLASELTRRRLICPYGTPFPTSVAEARNGTFFMLNNMRRPMRVSSGGWEDLGDQRVENKFSAMNSVGLYAWGLFARDKYWLAYTNSNPNVTAMSKAPIIYDTRTHPGTGREIGWLEDDPAGSITMEAMAAVDTTIYAQSNDRYAYYYDLSTVTDDEGTAFDCTVTFGLIHKDFREALTIRNIWLLCDDMTASGDVDFTVTYWPSGAVQSSEAELDSANTKGWIQSKSITNTSGTEFGGLGAQVSAVFSIPGGKKIYGMAIEVEDYELHPSASA